jgi:farnesyl diphosphate synthase
MRPLERMNLPIPERQSLDISLTAARDLVAETIACSLHPYDSALCQPMSYAVHGGKGLRGFLVLESARIHGVHPAQAANVAAAIECIHAYSLVHDDMPCMDDDDLRRGHPTVHRKWDEATAVLAGDALQSLGFELIADASLPDGAKIDLMRSFSRAAGVGGMVGGQVLDIAAETAATPLTLPEITRLQAGKTGALITWSAAAGARMADENTCFLEDYGDALGLAFQIWDDVLDVEGDSAKVGKAVGKDASAGKATFVSLLGLDAAKLRARDLVQQACDALDVYGDQAETLRDAARFVISRDN